MASQNPNKKEVVEGEPEKQYHFSIYNKSTIPFFVRVKDNTLRIPVTRRIDAEGWFIHQITPECRMYIQWFDDPITSLLDTYALCMILFIIAILPYSIFTTSLYNIPIVYILLWSNFVFVILYFFSRPRSRQRCTVTMVPRRNIAYKFYLKRSLIEGIFSRSTFYDIESISKHLNP